MIKRKGGSVGLSLFIRSVISPLLFFSALFLSSSLFHFFCIFTPFPNLFISSTFVKTEKFILSSKASDNKMDRRTLREKDYICLSVFLLC